MSTPLRFKKKLTVLAASSLLAASLSLPAQASAESKEPVLTIPLRAAAEQIGATVGWNADLMQASVTRAGKEFIVTIGEKAASINKQAVEMQQEAALVDDLTVVPLATFNQAFDVRIEVSSNGAVTIDDQDVTTLGSQFIHLLQTGKFDDAYAMFGERLRTYMPSSAILQQLWIVNTSAYGTPGQLASIKHVKTAIHNNAELGYITDRGTPFGFAIRFDASGQIDDIYLPLMPSGAYAAPAYDKPDRYTEEEVVVGEGDFAVPGTLTLPKGEGPFPAVVLVHGSGANDRDETYAGYKTLRDLAVGLADQGYAILRHEKSTREHMLKSGLTPTFTYKEESVNDALKSATLLASDKRIDAKRVFVLGHSQGGMLVPSILQEDTEGKFAGAIIMAGPSQSLENIMIEQNQFMIDLAVKAGQPAEAIAVMNQQAEAWKGIVKLLQDPKLDIQNPPKELAIPNLYWWYTFRNYSGPAIASKQSQPLLILQGENDWQVPAGELDGWKKGLSARTNVEYKSYPKLNHYMVASEQPSTGAEYAIPGNVSASVIDDIAAWLGKQK